MPIQRDYRGKKGLWGEDLKRFLDRSALKDFNNIPDWFSWEEPNSIPDWFSFMRLAK